MFPTEFVAAKGLTVIADREVLQSMVEEVLQNHQELVKRY